MAAAGEAEGDGQRWDMARRGINRRDFLKCCGALAAALALPRSYASHIAAALENSPRLPLIWLEFQDCTGDSESFLRASRRSSPIRGNPDNPGIVDLLLDVISLDYHETLMAPAGKDSERSLQETMAAYYGQYVCVVEGAIPMADGGVYCTIRGRTALSIAREVLPGAKATLAIGACAVDGGLAAAAPNLTGAAGVNQAMPSLSNLVNLPGCPANVVNIVAVIVHLITFGALPAMDSRRRPYFAYGEEIHEECERHHHYEAGRFARAWGDEGHRKGWCLYQMGCRGPRTDHNCSIVKWNDGVCWPIGAGHGCIGCASPRFWDVMSPFYTPLPDEHD